ncbi:MAG: HIT family protein, partial [Pseudomonadota bacterium]
QVDGHTLVIPKDPAMDLLDVDPVILGHTSVTVQKVANAVKSAFSAPGIMIAQLNGSAAGQTVFHLHFHIMPRFAGIEFKMHAREMEDFTKLEQFAEQIRAQLPASGAS